METDNIFPDNWKEVVRGKKVIFYNTSVGSMLAGREKHIEKMKWVFDVFREHPEVVLWWRPHPLELSTMKSMLPALAQQYMELRTLYQKENVGILDESTDLHRAIAISDAYYGDWSSVVELYKAAKKPILFQQNRIKSIKDAVFIPITMCIKDEAIWFIQFNSNKLIKMDRCTCEVKKVVNIPGEPLSLWRFYNYHIIDAGDSLILLLEKGQQIYEYEIGTDSIKVHKPHMENFVFHSEIVVENDKKLFLFPYRNNSILEYDYRNNTMIEKKFGQQKIKAAKCCEIVGSNIYMVDKGSNDLYQYDMVNGSYKVIKIGFENNKYWGVRKVGDCFILPHVKKRAITIWNKENGEVMELTEFPEGYSCLEEYAYLDMFEQNGKLYIFPFYSNMILKLDIENRKIIQAFEDIFYTGDYDMHSEQYSGEMYLCAEKYQNCVWAYALYKKSWDIFNLETETIKSRKDFKIEKPEYKEMLECIIDDSEYMESFSQNESTEIFTLENYIKNIQNCDTGSKYQQAGRSSIGVDIHKSLINEL